MYAVSSLFFRNLKREHPVIAGAVGSWVTDTEGNTCLDGSKGAMVSNLGHLSSLDMVSVAGDHLNDTGERSFN